jgi:hypothetical protein
VSLAYHPMELASKTTFGIIGGEFGVDLGIG